MVHWTSPSVSSHSVQWAGHAVKRKHVCCHILMMLLQWQKIRKIFTVPRYKLLLSFTIISYVYRSLIPNEATFTKCCLPQGISKLWNLLSKAVLGKFHESGGYSKRDCLQDRANFRRSWSWQIVLILTRSLCLCDFYDVTQTGKRKGVHM